MNSYAGLREYDEYDEHECLMEERAERKYRSALYAHPSCRDPDHPGCYKCETPDPYGEEYEE